MPNFYFKNRSSWPVLFFRKHISNSALFRRKHSTPVKYGMGLVNMSLPTRAQALVLFGYLIMNVVFLVIRYDVFEGNIRFPEISRQVCFYVGDRAGILAVSHFPLMVAFAGRNNVFLWLTGWSFDTFNTYHRWLSRMMFTLGFIHAICFTVFYHINHRYTHEFTITFMKWGAVSITAGGLILFFALRHFRENFYETFLFIHWVLVGVFFAGMWCHLATDSLPFRDYIYTAIALWGFDRVARILRIFVSSINSKAQVELHPQNIIKFKIKYSHMWNAKPGSYVFVHFLRPVWTFWQSHPFSCYPSPISGEENHLVLSVRVRDGRTKKLAQYLAKNQGQSLIPILLDSPYGHRFPIANSNTIVFIAGGIGVTATYSYACQLRETGETKRIIFIWVIRNHENVDWFKDELNYIGQRNNIDIQLYITDENDPSRFRNGDKSSGHMFREAELSLDEATEEKTEKDTSLLASPATAQYSVFNNIISYGRPNFKSIVDGIIADAPGSVGVMVCGPDGLNDDIRKYVTQNIDKGQGRVDLYVEAFNW